MEADAQVSQLEQALLQQAETLAREQLQNAEATCARIRAESAAKLKLAEEREILAAKVEAERQVRRQIQAAETRLSAELDRLRWTLTESTQAEVRTAFRRLVADQARYLGVLEAWLAAAAQALPPGDLAVEVRHEDDAWLAPVWPEIVVRAAPGRAATLVAHGQPSEGGLRVRLADDRARVDQTFEARQARLADELARVVMERLFASAPDLGTLVHG
ncbi:V-type ATP synthase subunit E [Thiobacillus sedimenti]|uniref:V-type ATP synthase subunit E n=1 Tax=Thiobacillus sedimenti TaxID=3110231 RepID=A0ABZ1CMS7_9PROT|nr:V-type ATP synthase subunit E family protein [Thiobacillus sp. SCUT-2]WRS40581.1 V-type ATP synthase subunit E family protein [Thiobacillus sp. SCUT-2]